MFMTVTSKMMLHFTKLGVHWIYVWDRKYWKDSMGTQSLHLSMTWDAAFTPFIGNINFLCLCSPAVQVTQADANCNPDIWEFWFYWQFYTLYVSVYPAFILHPQSCPKQMQMMSCSVSLGQSGAQILGHQQSTSTKHKSSKRYLHMLCVLASLVYSRGLLSWVSFRHLHTAPLLPHRGPNFL